RRCRPPVAIRPTDCVRGPGPTASSFPVPTTARPAVGTPTCWGHITRRPGPSTAVPLPRTDGDRPADKPPTRGNRGPMTRVPIRMTLMKVATTTAASTDGGQDNPQTVLRHLPARERAGSFPGRGRSTVGRILGFVVATILLNTGGLVRGKQNDQHDRQYRQTEEDHPKRGGFEQIAPIPVTRTPAVPSHPSPGRRGFHRSTASGSGRQSQCYGMAGTATISTGL